MAEYRTLARVNLSATDNFQNRLNVSGRWEASEVSQVLRGKNAGSSTFLSALCDKKIYFEGVNFSLQQLLSLSFIPFTMNHLLTHLWVIGNALGSHVKYFTHSPPECFQKILFIDISSKSHTKWDEIKGSTANLRCHWEVVCPSGGGVPKKTVRSLVVCPWRGC